MEAISSRAIPSTNKHKALTLVIVLFLSVGCASHPDPTPVYDEVEETLSEFVEEIEQGRWLPVLAPGVDAEDPKKELANMKRRRLERLKQNLKTVQAAQGKK